MDINFEDPEALLSEISKHRMAYVYLKQISDFESEISRKRAEISRLRDEIQPIQRILEKNREYYERGFYDRVGYEETQVIPLSQHRKIFSQIKELEKSKGIIENEVLNFTACAEPSLKFLEDIQKKVVTYSIVQIRNKKISQTYLMVPNGLRNFVYMPDLELLTTESDLGRTLMFQEVGKVFSKDSRFQELELLSVRIAEDELLVEITDFYFKMKHNAGTKIYIGLVSTEQRRRDGGRDELHSTCPDCNKFIPLWTKCRCSIK